MFNNINKNYISFILFSFIFFVSPRVTFLNFSFLPTSIRIEDLLIAIFVLIYFRNILNFKVTTIDKLFFLFFIYLSINYLNGLYSGQQVSIFNFFRLIEIYLVFLIGRVFSKYLSSFSGILFTILLINFIIISFQKFDLFPAFRAQGVYYHTSVRAYGLFGGPWELASFFPLAGLVIQNNLSLIRSIILANFVTIFCLLSGSRTFILSLPVYLAHKFQMRQILYIFSIAILIFAICLIFIKSDTFITYYGRIISLIGIDNYKAFLTYNYFTFDPIFKDWVEYNVIRDDRDPYFDLSLSKRLHKWSQVLYIYTYDFKNFFLGVGIGVFGNAVDGGWIRLFAELGLIGGIIFIAICYYSITTKLVLFMFIILFINMIFIDIYQSLKIIGLIFFTVGLYQGNNGKK